MSDNLINELNTFINYINKQEKFTDREYQRRI